MDVLSLHFRITLQLRRSLYWFSQEKVICVKGPKAEAQRALRGGHNLNVPLLILTHLQACQRACCALPDPILLLVCEQRSYLVRVRPEEHISH